MRKSPPKAPIAPDWDSLRQNRQTLSPENLNELAELSSRYLQTEAVEFSEEDLVSNLRSLYEQSRQQNTKISKAHAKKIQKMVLGAFSKFGGGAARKLGGSDGPHTEAISKRQTFVSRIFHKPKSEEALISERARKLEEARQLVEKADSALPETKKEVRKAFGLFFKAEGIYRELGEYDKAFGVLKTMESKNMLWKIKERARFVVAKKMASLAKIYSEKKEYDKSIECLEEAIKAKPHLLYHYFDYLIAHTTEKAGKRWSEEIGKQYIAAGKYKEAGDFHRGNYKDGNAGVAYELGGDFEKAAEAFRNAQDWENAARVFEKIGKNDEAGRCYMTAATNQNVPNSPLKFSLALVGSGLAELVYMTIAHSTANGALAYTMIGSVMTGIATMFDGGIIHPPFSLTKRFYKKNKLKELGQKAMANYNMHLEKLLKENDPVKLLEYCSGMSIQWQDDNWKNYDLGQRFLPRATCLELKNKYTGIAKGNLISAIEKRRDDPIAALTMIGNYGRSLADEKQKEQMRKMLHELEQTVEKEHPPLVAARYYLSYAGTLGDGLGEKAAELKSRGIGILLDMGNRLFDEGKRDEAHGVLFEAVRAIPANESVGIALGFAKKYYDIGDLKSAASFYSHAKQFESRLDNKKRYEYLETICSEFANDKTDVVVSKIVPALINFSPLESNPRLIHMFIPEVREKMAVFEKLKEKQMPEALSRIFKRIDAGYTEFNSYYLKGRPIPQECQNFFHSEMKNILGKNFENEVLQVCNAVNVKQPDIKSPKDFARAYYEINGKIKPKYAYPVHVAARKFALKGVNLSVPEELNRKLMDSLNKSRGEDSKTLVNDISKRVDAMTEAFKAGQDAVMKCMNDYGIPQDVINAYTKGKMSSEDAIRLNLKRTEFPDLSPFAWEVIGRIETANPGARALFERYSMYGTNAGEGSLSSDETNRFFTLLREFDEFLGDYLVEKRLSALEPKVRASEACKAISTAVTNIQSKEAEIEKNTRELRLVFSPNYRMFDAMFPHYAGECLSVQSLAKKHVVTATLFQNGEIAGGVLMLMKRVNGRKSLVVIGIDPSVKVVSGIGKEAAMDICDWMMKEVHDYGKANGYGLYITRNIGGITNRYELRRSMGRYFGWGVFPLGFAVDHYFSGTVRNFHLPRKLKKPSAEEMSRRTMVKELYRIEKKVFADNPSIILGKGEFKEMFTDSTAYAVLKKEGKYAGFAVANSVIEKSLLGDDTDEVLAQLRTTLGKVDLAKFEKSLEQDKVYYLDDIAILDRSMGTRKMMREFFQSLESQGADTLLFHARMKEGRIGDFERVMELGGFRKIDEHVEKGWFGGEDFMFMAYFKDQKPSQTSG